MPRIFTHARSATVIADPNDLISTAYEEGRFSTHCPLPPDDAAVTEALRGNGTMPVAGARLFGLATAQLVLVVSACAVALVGLLLLGAGSVSGVGVGSVLLVLGAGILAFTVLSARSRRRRLVALATAWQNGWLRFAPARVGAVWVDRRVTHGRANSQGANQDNRYWFRAVVEVHPTDGSPTFTVVTDPFQALANRDGVPHDLVSAPNPVDAFEPEYTNGWTVARYVAGPTETMAASATVTTNLSSTQIGAALRAAGVR
ncbi:hypothetical protein BJF89_09305 [Corynebacterium sp. CNJ-954]|uniref:hypothetical protein n=1 Tax=Corynebacterium sp. CNJ-954 TaxID=1904962 RepID=UPI000961672C|nr:hypothetical protein [Corynebacterium sp. CNJ-954]OLT50644.1 hypothetical protein BJF89_09305 [Corynebacterium sp. CNJ-954]